MYGCRTEYGVFQDLMTYKTFLRPIFTEFDRKVDFQNHLFGRIRCENRFFMNY